MMIEGAEPFLFRGGKEGVLLIHGFTGSPAELLLLGEFLNHAGYTVLCVRLAGHGTSEFDLERTTCADWFNSVLDGYAMLKSSCEKIFVVGHSMGSLLSLKLAALKHVDKLVTLSPPFFINEELHLEQLPPRSECENLFTFKPRRKLHNVPPAVNKTYRKLPLVCVHEFLILLNEVTEILSKVRTPLLIMHAEDDHTAKFESAEFLFNAVSSEQIKLVKIPTGGHLIPLTEGRDFVFENILEFLISSE
ncbi:MAG: alpha/beta fold hydrolase [Selenomonadaceae bacterium]|nr:alpha/beta fold hydrolase [Selenomonadaceae bacterium]